MANNKTKQAKEILLTLLQDSEPLPLEVVYSRCNCDYEALTGALRSMIEKEEVRIGRLKTSPGWLIGNNNVNIAAGGATWHTMRGQMRHSLPKILRELKKYAPLPESCFEDRLEEKQFLAISELLSDGKPRSQFEIMAATGMEAVSPLVWRRFARLPDKRYTLPDSSGAREYFLEYICEKPRRLTNLLRLFRKHKSIIAMIANNNHSDRLIRLPRGLITTTDSPAGKIEAERRRRLKFCTDTVNMLPYPFFNLEELGLTQKEFNAIADKNTVTVNFSDKEYRCLRREFPGDVLVSQLGELSGRYFAPPDQASAPAFLKQYSAGEKEAASLLGINVEMLNHLVNTNIINAFTIDDKKRLWRSDVEALRRDSTRLRNLRMENEQLSIPEAAAMLGITITQLRRLVDDDKLNSAAGSAQGPGTAYLIKYSELKKLQKKLPVLQRDGDNTSKLKQGGPEAGEIKRFSTKKTPVRRERIPQVETEQIFLDSFQTEAVEALGAGLSVLVSAPTGNGKTLVAEILARNLMGAGSGIVYTSPLKALSNQKYRDFKELFGVAKVGLVTGDISINPDAPMLIMTTEIFRNWCLGEPEQLLKTAYVVFDEIHYLDDTERGTTWEESILFAPPHVKFLGLSATVPNINEIADWISTVRGEKVVVVEERKRYVPLEIHWIMPSGRIVEENEARQEVEELAEYLKALRNKKKWLKE
ncbi:MAG: DEAD/DEAH box helicase [Desulfotomaculaceae bacterium]|nr:DEAD/DEAH box helicase [Desulfotomaculaceae bacterium]